jgi:hypothetical protein
MKRQLSDPVVLDALVDVLTDDLRALPTVDEPTRVPEPLAPGVDVVSGLQAQGDVLILPAPDGAVMPHWQQPLPLDRAVPLIRHGNGHVLRALARGDGRVWWAPMDGYENLIACLHVVGDAVALVEQPGDGHDPLGIGPGMYQIRRQRERATPTPQAFDWNAWTAD